MAWVERFTCDICGKLMGDTGSWWVAQNECATSSDQGPTRPTLKLTQWDNLLGHSSSSKHLCGASCAHTYLDRWMAEVNAGADTCPE